MKAAAATETAPRAGVVQCARCGHACAAESWRAQPMQTTLTGADLAACVVAWPEDSVVEVRGCPGCGTSIARRRRAS
jgi:hypothetical protein